MATVWELVTDNSTLPIAPENTFWDHLNNQKTGSGGGGNVFYFDNIQIEIDDLEIEVRVEDYEISVVIEEEEVIAEITEEPDAIISSGEIITNINE